MKKDPYAHLDKDAYRIAYLVAGYIRGSITEEEHDELNDWVNASDHNMLLFEELTDEKNLEANLAWMDEVQTRESYRRLRESGKLRTKQSRTTIAWIAAAVLLVIVGLFFIYRYAAKDIAGQREIAKSDSTTLEPGGNRATLRLSNGSVIDLTEAKTGLVKNEEGVDINKLRDGELEYVADISKNEPASIHTLSTPIGGQYQVRLPDGTRVWLNAASTIKYPSHFSGAERRVELDGEAYFEVAKNENQPFHVVVGDSVGVKVLGTHFNIMSYSNEASKEITLLEGTVSVNRMNQIEKLEPGMQARISGDKLTRQEGVDTDEITGWKNGNFVFHDTPIESIMHQVERWYGATVEYKGEIKQLFNATIRRSEPLTKLLHLLELNGYVHFKIDNKTVYVLP